jgi:predicted nucleotidyltransferase
MSKIASGLCNASEVAREAIRPLVDRSKAQPISPGPRKEDALRNLALLERSLRERGLTSVALFGSVVRGDARADSDIDILIDVDPGASFSLIDLVALKAFLEEQLGHRVDVVTRQGLDPLVRDRVQREAQAAF